jgi:ankyrin repeat protein
MAAADLVSGAPGQVRDEQGGMPLHRAAYMGHIELVDVRARHDAPPAQTGLSPSPDGVWDSPPV